MRYYSTKQHSVDITLRNALIDCYAPDGGQYLPAGLPVVPRAFINNMSEMSLKETAFVICNMLFGDDIASARLKAIADEALSFDMPLISAGRDRYMIELFHGPTLAFKDISARFMAGLTKELYHDEAKPLNVIVTTIGNTGAAVANSFRNVKNTNVFVLFPKGVLNRSQQMQITAAGDNVRAIEVAGTIDDCKKMAGAAMLDESLRQKMNITSANSANIARLLPQVIIFFYAAARLNAMGVNPEKTVFSIPSGNLSAVTSGVISRRMGLGLGKLIAACNGNNPFYRYLVTGQIISKPVRQTLARCMDTDTPTNLERLISLYGNDQSRIREEIETATIGDDMIKAAINRVLTEHGAFIDPHTAVAFAAADMLHPNEAALIFSTEHPAKSLDVMTSVTGKAMELPLQLTRFMAKAVHTDKLPPTYPALKKYLLQKQ